MNDSKKHAVTIGVRIGALFLLSICVIIFVTYYVLSQNLHNQLTTYSIGLIQSMAEQGVKTVENELRLERREVTALAAALEAPEAGEPASFPSATLGEQALRMLYVTAEGTVASDGRQRDVGDRPDIREALEGETSVYGPYFNEEGEFVVCYTAPVLRAGEIVGALSVEKDGFRFCELIENIRFFDTGECYIINAEGTDIAVSDQEHLSWVTEQYNSQALYEAYGDPETKSILDLEYKGLAGERGVGTYYWNDGLVYVIYEPIHSEGWVLFAGMREEEIAAITKSTLFASLSSGPALTISLLVFAVLVVLIVFWMIASFKKNTEINEKLEVIANHDALTGLLNRRFLETSLTQLWKCPVKVPCEAAVFMTDIDDFKLYNDALGHLCGDDCLCQIAIVFKEALAAYSSHVLRYGGEEFMTVVFQIDMERAGALAEKICRMVEESLMSNGRGGHVTVSIGVCHVDSTLDASLLDCIKGADQALYQAKREGKNRSVVTSAPGPSALLYPASAPSLNCNL